MNTYNASEVARCADDAADDTVGVGVHVRNKRVVETVGALEEEGEATTDESDKGGQLGGVGDTDDDHEDTSHGAVDVKKDLLAPDAFGLAVCKVGDETTEGTADDVEETEHGGPVARVLETELEVLGVVGAEDAVDGELGTEGAEVAGGDGESLEGEDDLHGLAERRLLDDLTTGSVEHLLLSELSLIVTKDTAGLVELLLLAGKVASGGRLAALLLLDGRDLTRNHDNVALNAVLAEVVLSSLEAVGPLAGGSVLAAEEEGKSDSGNDNTRNDEGDAP